MIITKSDMDTTQKEAPPPYSQSLERRLPSRPPSRLPSRNFLPPVPIATPSPVFDAAPMFSSPATNNLNIKTRKEPISGIFQIDPVLSILGVSSEKRDLKKKKSRRSKKLKNLWPWQNMSPENEVPNATFQTRQGNVNLDLAVVGYGANEKALVDIMTRQGNVDLNVFQIEGSRNLNLRVTTRSGNIFVLLPRPFSGPVHLQTRNGTILFLSSLARSMRPVTMREDESLILIGEGPFPADTPNNSSWVGDYLSLMSRHGNVTVGYIGEDMKPEHGGFWKKIADFMHNVTHKHQVTQ